MNNIGACSGLDRDDLARDRFAHIYQYLVLACRDRVVGSGKPLADWCAF